MLRKTLKFSIIALAMLAIFSRHAKADSAAFTLHGIDQDFPVSASELQKWQTPTNNSISFISFEPEQNPNRYILDELGLIGSATHQADYENYNIPEIYSFLTTIEQKINSDPENAVFKMENDTVTDFNPGKEGQDLDAKSSIDQIVADLESNKTESTLAISTVDPQTKLADTNDMGIKELVAEGDSSWAGSPANRIFNIKVGVKKESGTIIAPGEEFSFNKYLGPVDGEHGFLPELVIKASGTIPEFGGGLCQVSTTVFRAAANAGFPITARRNHSYAVSYYAPQGTDATIYPGVQDLKFINDSPAHILIWGELTDSKHLHFYIYGTSDHRQVSFDGPHQYDQKPDGSLKAIWSRTVVMPDGTIKKDDFKSVYEPPALFHKEETFPPKQPASATVPTTNQTSPTT